jgi:hypothetical protein
MVSVCRPLVVRVIFGTVLSLTIFAAQFRCNVAIPWVKWLFAGLSLRRPGFCVSVSPCGICGGRNGTGTGFSPSSSVLPRQYNPTVIQHVGMNS